MSDNEICPYCGEYYCECEGVPAEEDEDDSLEEGEVNLFASMPWINQNIGSMMEAELLRYREPNQCRRCGKIDEALRTKKPDERFCCEKCRSDWNALLRARIAQGKHDLRTRGFD